MNLSQCWSGRFEDKLDNIPKIKKIFYNIIMKYSESISNTCILNTPNVF